METNVHNIEATKMSDIETLFCLLIMRLGGKVTFTDEEVLDFLAGTYSIRIEESIDGKTITHTVTKVTS